MLTSKVGIRVFAAGAVSLAALLIAQNPTSNRATLYGTVVDPAGAAIAGANVTAKPRPSGKELSIATGKAGKYELNLPAGEYDVSVTSPGFKQFQRRITLAAGVRWRQDVT